MENSISKFLFRDVPGDAVAHNDVKAIFYW